MAGKSTDPLQVAISLNLIQTDDKGLVMKWVQQALDKMPDKVIEYKKGKKGLLGLFVGEVKKISQERQTLNEPANCSYKN